MTDQRPACRFGSNCYQQNAQHLTGFRHPPKGEEEEPAKNNKRPFSPQDKAPQYKAPKKNKPSSLAPAPAPAPAPFLAPAQDPAQYQAPYPAPFILPTNYVPFKTYLEYTKKFIEECYSLYDLKTNSFPDGFVIDTKTEFIYPYGDDKTFENHNCLHFYVLANILCNSDEFLGLTNKSWEFWNKLLMYLFEENSITGRYPLLQVGGLAKLQRDDSDNLIECIKKLNTKDPNNTGYNLVREKDASDLSNTLLLLLLEPRLKGKPLLPPPAAEGGGRSRRRRRKYSKRVRRTCKPNKKRTRRNKLKKN